MTDEQTTIPVQEVTSAEAPVQPAVAPATAAHAPKVNVEIIKKDIRIVRDHIKALPKDRRWQLYVGAFLILSVSVLPWLFGIVFSPRLVTVIFYYFVPIAIGALMVLSAYTGKNIVKEMEKKKAAQKPTVGKVEIQEEDVITEVPAENK